MGRKRTRLLVPVQRNAEEPAEESPKTVVLDETNGVSVEIAGNTIETYSETATPEIERTSSDVDVSFYLNEISKKEEENRRLIEDIAALKKKLGDADVAAIRANGLQSENDRLKSENERLKSEVNRLTATVNNITESNDDLVLRNSELEFENSRLNGVIDELRNSNRGNIPKKPVDIPLRKEYTCGSRPIRNHNYISNNGYESWN